MDHEFSEPYLKPDWDPVLFSNSCYIAHLCGVDRLRALELGAYTDPTTEASPDWDLFMRFANAGVEPLHVPEVLYSWRIHGASTAGDSRVKPYAFETHRRVLEQFIGHRPDADNFAIEIHPDSPDRLDWWVRRRELDPRPLVTVIIGADPKAIPDSLPEVDHRIHALDVNDVEGFTAIVEDSVAINALVHVLNSSATMLRSNWYWEALGLMELHPDVVAVGGPVVRDDRIVSAGEVFGFEPFGWGSPAAGEAAHSRGWFAQNLKQRSVDGLSGDHVVYDGRSLHAVVANQDLRSLATLGAWSSVHAARSGHRVVYSPLLRAYVTGPFHEQWTDTERFEIGQAAAHLAGPRNRSEFLSLDVAEPFEPTTKSKRDEHLREVIERILPPSTRYHDWILHQIETRRERYPARIAGPSLSVITPVYFGTDAALLSELSACLDDQSTSPLEWIIGIDGEIPPDLEQLIGKLVASGRTRTVGGAKVGILGTMRACLDDCSADYVVPVDADDLLTPDALAILGSVALSEQLPDLVHSDEDILDGDRYRDPFLRPDWDPVLHLASSYVWHALCIKRSTALDVGLYTDPNYEWCHDWDTVERIRRVGGRIVHVPEVLYHWRRHSGSSTNTERPESAQQDSVKAMFTRMAADTRHPDRYEIAEFPLWRGATEFHLLRRPVDPPTLSILTLGQLTAATYGSVADANNFPIEAISVGPSPDAPIGTLVTALEHVDSTLVWILDPTIIVGGDKPVWEAVKWFDLLDDVGAVCGRFVSSDGIVRTGAELADDSEPAGVLHPLAGRKLTDPGPYALALKPHSIDLVDTFNAVVDSKRFMAALRAVPQDLPIVASGLKLGRSMASCGSRVVYTPLITSLDPGTRILPTVPVDTSQSARRGMKPISDGRRHFL